MSSRRDYARQASALFDSINKNPIKPTPIVKTEKLVENKPKSERSFHTLAEALQAKSGGVLPTTNTAVSEPVNITVNTDVPVEQDLKNEEFPIGSKWVLKRGRIVFKISRVMPAYEKLELIRATGTSKPTIIEFAEFREKYIRRE